MKTIKVENINSDTILQILHQTLTEMKCEDIEIDKNTETIIAKTNLSFLSFGEKIMISITQISKDVKDVSISSKSLFPLQIIDWATNSDNIDLIIEEFEKKLSI